MSNEYLAEIPKYKNMPDEAPFSRKKRSYDKVIAPPTREPEVMPDPLPSTSSYDPNLGQINLAPAHVFNMSAGPSTLSDAPVAQVTLAPVNNDMPEPASPFGDPGDLENLLTPSSDDLYPSGGVYNYD